MDVKIINPFLEAAQNVITTMARIETKVGKPYIKKDSSSLGDVSGIIGITGDASGSFSITFTESCIKAIVSNMLGMEVTELNDDVKDAVGELTNMICGDARRRLEEQGIKLVGAIPTIIAGKGHSITHMAKGPILVVPFETPNGPFVIELALDSNNN